MSNYRIAIDSRSSLKSLKLREKAFDKELLTGLSSTDLDLKSSLLTLSGDSEDDPLRTRTGEKKLLVSGGGGASSDEGWFQLNVDSVERATLSDPPDASRRDAAATATALISASVEPAA